MLEVKDNCLIIDGAIKPLKTIDIVLSFEHDFYFLDTKSGVCREYPYTIKELYRVLQKADLHNFVFVKNTIINLNKIDYVWLEDCKDENAAQVANDFDNRNRYAAYVLVLAFKTGRKEEIYFDMHQEAEEVYREVGSKLSEIKSNPATCN